VAVAWLVARRFRAAVVRQVDRGTDRRPRPADEDVQFTVYRPRAVVPERWYTLLAFAHLAAKRGDAPPASQSRRRR
jgi:hypothetical protein